jgi:peptidyl-prolyl cis-trans isomerase B (cyclophilin B)
VSCDYPESGQPPAKEVDPPSGTATETGEVAATMTTSAGELGLSLDADAAPCTVHSFLSLAEQGYFDDTPCHRLVAGGIHVLQCGDPTGTGTGGPGYSFPDELTGSETYPAGSLAMANAGPDTNGSQFFIVYDETPLDPNYTVFGTVDTAGIKIVESLARAGVAGGGADGAPAIPIAIKSVTVD